MKNKIIAFLLVLTTLVSLTTIFASAASGEEYISEVSLIYENSVYEAKEAIAGTDWKLWEKDLNPLADIATLDGVYLIYKTSTNVEDAITDLRVMDMYGGYSTSNYKNQLEATRKEYMKKIAYVRAVAEEFKTLYNAGDKMAELAYRQMNYYKDISETEKLMGDFMLNIPSDDALVTVMMEGNAYIASNLISLLAVGISGGSGKSLAERVNEMYAIKDTLTDIDYYDDASALANEFKELTAVVKRYDALLEDYDLDDEDMTDEEAQFVVRYASVALALEKIPYGEETLKDFIARDSWEIKDLYPVAAALSDGQMALTEMGVFTTVLQYNSPSASIEELYAVVEENEKTFTDENGNIEVFDVYLGVDRSIFEGNFAFTNAAERNQAVTGEVWNLSDYLSSEEANAAVPTELVTKMMISGAALALGPSVTSKLAIEMIYWFGATQNKLTGHIAFNWFGDTFGPAILKYSKFMIGNGHYFTGGVSKFLTPIGVGLLVAAVGITVISVFYGYYNPDYTPIPDNIIDIRETDIGDRYIKYTAAKVYNDPDGRNADFNAYQGKEWNALYYTKDASAGKCLTPKFVYSENSSAVARRHQAISMFGESEAFNVNSHVFYGSAPAVYVTIRYSTAKKAAADVPTVVGSMFSDGALYTLTALGGAAVGVGATFAIGALKKKKEEPAEAES
jgi:hypothetical protein